MKNIIFIIIVLSWIALANGYELTGDNLIEPRFYEGNLLIMNEGFIPYAVFSDGDYLGSIEHNQGMYVNESFDYKLYASYNEIRDYENPEYLEKKFNQWWLIVLVFIIGLFFVIGVYKVIK